MSLQSLARIELALALLSLAIGGISIGWLTSGQDGPEVFVGGWLIVAGLALVLSLSAARAALASRRSLAMIGSTLALTICAAMLIFDSPVFSQAL